MDSVPLIGSLVILAAVFVMILIGKIVAHLFSIIMLACAIAFIVYALYSQLKRTSS